MTTTIITDVFHQGTHVDRPSAGSNNLGWQYFETDTKTLFQSDGSSWVQLAPSVGAPIPPVVVDLTFSDSPYTPPNGQVWLRCDTTGGNIDISTAATPVDVDQIVITNFGNGTVNFNSSQIVIPNPGIVGQTTATVGVSYDATTSMYVATGSSTYLLTQLFDVNSDGESDGDVLVYDGSSNRWELQEYVPIASGGTGAGDANSALNNLLPSQTGEIGDVLTTDGSNTSWTTPSNVPGGSAGGDLGGTYPNPDVEAVDGVVFSGVPTAGQVPVASSGSAAAWGNAAPIPTANNPSPQSLTSGTPYRNTSGKNQVLAVTYVSNVSVTSTVSLVRI